MSVDSMSLHEVELQLATVIFSITKRVYVRPFVG